MRCEGREGAMASPSVPRQIQAIVKARQIPESRSGSSVCTSQSFQEASQSLHHAPQAGHHLPSPTLFLKTHIHLVIKNQKLRSANCSPWNLHPQAARTSPQPQRLPATRLTQKPWAYMWQLQRWRPTLKIPETWWKYKTDLKDCLRIICSRLLLLGLHHA